MNAPLTPDTNLAVLVLDLFDPTGRHDLAAIHPTTGEISNRTLERAKAPSLRDWTNARQGSWNLYFQPNRPREDVPPNKKISSADIGYIRAISFDIDPTKIKGGDFTGDHFHKERDRLATLVGTIAADEDHKPSLTIDTGGGYQLHWVLDPVVEATSTNVEVAEGIGRALKQRFGGDSTWSVSQLMRLPGTINIPTATKREQGREPALATIVSDYCSCKKYALAALAAWAPPIPRKTTKAVDPHADIDMGVVLDAAHYEDLPSDLRLRFEAICAAHPSLKALWETGEHPHQKDTSGSGREFSLARFLRAGGGFTATEYGQLVMVWQHQRAVPERDIERDLRRSWSHNPDGNGAFEDRSANDPSTRLPVAGSSCAPTQSDPAWGDPSNLWLDDAEPADLPHGVVPPIIEGVARDHALRLGVEAGGPTAALVTTLGSLVHAGNHIQMRQHDTGWIVRPILWTAIVADSGANKSATLDYAKQPLKPIEAKFNLEYAQAVRKHELRRSPTKKKPKADDAVQPFEAVTQNEVDFDPGDTAVESVKPVLRQIIINNATTEAIAEILHHNPGGILSFRDELAGFFGSMDAYRQKGGVDRPFWLEAKDGSAYTVNRRTSDPLIVEHNAVSVLGAIQPDAMRSISAGLATDGLLQRFLPIFLRRIGEGEDVMPDERLAAELDRVAMAMVESEDQRRFRFGAQADAELRAHQAFVADRLARPDALPAFRQWLEKSVNEFGRLSLVFHFLEWYSSLEFGVVGGPPPDIVSAETARRARRYLTEFAYPHANVFYRRILGGSPIEAHARWVAEFILSRALPSIRNRDVYKNYPALKKPERRREVELTMRHLEMLDWLRPANLTNQGPTLWTVNPAVHVAFHEKAEQERARRETTRENIRRNGEILAAGRAAEGVSA
jgi:hypothetical protein